MKQQQQKALFRYIPIAVFSLGLLFTISIVTGWISLGNEHMITRRVVGIPYEKALADYCETLHTLDGVTNVEYDEFDPVNGSALVTVHYQPDVTSPKVIMVWLGNTKTIWDKPVIA